MNQIIEGGFSFVASLINKGKIALVAITAVSVRLMGVIWRRFLRPGMTKETHCKAKEPAKAAVK